MNQVDARHEIIREWRSLPKEQRQTDEQAALFAMQRRANHEDVGNAQAIKASDSNRIARSVSVFELPLSMAR